MGKVLSWIKMCGAPHRTALRSEGSAMSLGGEDPVILDGLLSWGPSLLLCCCDKTLNETNLKRNQFILLMISQYRPLLRKLRRKLEGRTEAKPWRSVAYYLVPHGLLSCFLV